MFGKDHLDVPQSYWENVLWTVEKKEPCIPATEAHPHREAWWKEHRGLMLLCCLMLLCWSGHFRIIVSRDFTGECEDRSSTDLWEWGCKSVISYRKCLVELLLLKEDRILNLRVYFVQPVLSAITQCCQWNFVKYNCLCVLAGLLSI